MAACSDSRSNPTVVSPVLPSGPQASATEPFNSTGVCLAEDAFLSGAVNGVNDNQDLADPAQNCTANDIRIATADVLEYSFDGTTFLPFDPANPISCTENQPIFLNLEAHLQETATSERTDIGVWIGLEGGNARTGTCNHYNLVNGTTGVSNIDNDSCGDMVNAATATVPLGIIDAVCQTATPTSTQLHIGSCLGWTQPGGDQVCPQGGNNTPNGFRFGTVPGTTSKCNCEGFDVPITVQKVAKIEIVKSCVPSNDPGTFDLKIDGSFTDTQGTFGDNKACGTSTGQRTVGAGTNVSPGADHTVAEDGFSIAASNYTSTVSCTKNGSAYIASQAYTTPNTLAVHTDPNDVVVCTFVNTRKPSLTLVKRIVNNNGGTAVVGAFGITTNAPGTFTFGAGVADGANTLKYTTNTVLLNAGGTFSLSENNVAGYTEGTWACTGVAGAVVPTFNAGSVVIAAGEQAVCTITNDDQGGTLQLVKRITNDNGGTKVVADFGLATNAGALVFGAGVADGANTLKYTSNAIGVNAGTFTLTELNVAGYTEGTWGCTGAAGAVVPTFNAGSVVVGLGETVVCTITNNDDPASLIIVKRIVNDNGGTKVVADFGITTSAGALVFGAGVADGANTLKYTATTLTGLSAGLKTLVELNVAGYAEGTWGCTGNAGAVVPTFNAGSVVLGNGETVTCTITNDDSPASLQLVKRITNDNGGTKVVADFGLATNAGALVFGAGVADGANTLKYSSNVLPVGAGTFTLTELNVAGYTEGTWGCTGAAGAVVPTFNAGSVVVANGESVVCTITNNDDPASLIIVKRIVNDNGGTKVVADFGITTSAGALVFGAGVADGANTLKYTATTLTGLSAGLKTLVELNVAGYTEGTWGCTGNAGAVVPTFNAGSVVLGNGETVTCTITNNDQPATLTIIKIVQGAGTTFTFNTNSGASATPLPASFNLVPPSDGQAQQVFNNLNAGTYGVTEVVPSGYTLTDLSCTGSFSQVYDPTVTQTVSPVLPNGGAVTCTFVNSAPVGNVTRTQGFWATHSGLTFAVWFGGTSGGNTFPGIADKTLCGRSIDTIGKLLGGFWSGISMTSTKTKRSDLDQARMRLLQQLLAAILNNAAFGSSPTGPISIAAAKAAYCGTDIAAINAAASAMAAFNEGGDSGVFTPGASANGKVAKDLANLAFWDVLP